MFASSSNTAFLDNRLKRRLKESSCPILHSGLPGTKYDSRYPSHYQLAVCNALGGDRQSGEPLGKNNEENLRSLEELALTHNLPFHTQENYPKFLILGAKSLPSSDEGSSLCKSKVPYVGGFQRRVMLLRGKLVRLSISSRSHKC